jgi:TPR repeat protein
MSVRIWLVALGLLQPVLSHQSAAGPYEDGIAAETRGDHVAALQIWTGLAKQGRAEAQYRLALRYAEGHDVERDEAQAVYWYSRAAGRGHSASQLALALAYDNGRGISKSLSKAMKWYRRAAQQGNVEAQVALGLIYDTGRGVPRNEFQARKWYGLAVEQNDPRAQNNLGMIFAEGGMAAPDLINAYFMFSIAAAAGSADAAKNRDNISIKMTPAEIGQAKKLASDWLLVKQLENAARCRVTGTCG